AGAPEQGSDQAGVAKPDSEAVSASGSDPGRARRARRADPLAPPPAPWGSVPLVEIAVLVGILALLGGLIFASGTFRVILVVGGLLLCSVAGLEVAVREHVGGYRSHTLVLAGVPSVAVLAVLFYAAPSSFPPAARLACGAAVFGLAAWGLTVMFRARSGGRMFRIKPERRRR